MPPKSLCMYNSVDSRIVTRNPTRYVFKVNAPIPQVFRMRILDQTVGSMENVISLGTSYKLCCESSHSNTRAEVAVVVNVHKSASTY
jgi:hypothetical protein